MKKVVCLTTAIFAMSLTAGASLAQSSHQTAGSKYKDGTISFTFPKHWKKLSHSSAMSAGAPLTGGDKHLKLADAAAVDHQISKHSGEVVIIAKLSFDATTQKQLKGKHQVFLSHFIKGIEKDKGVHVISKSSTTFAGAGGDTIEVTQKSGSTKSHNRYDVSIPNNNKALNIGLFVATPSKVWSQAHSIFAGVAKSVKIH